MIGFGRWSRLSLRRKSMLVLCVPLVPLLASAVAIVYAAMEQRAAQQWLARTIDVKPLIAATEQRASDSEIVIKDHWLNHDPEGLRRFDVLFQTWPAAFQQLRTAVEDNRAQLAHVDAIAATGADRALALRDHRVRYPDATVPPADLLDDLTQSDDTGANAYVVKPVDFHEFVNVVQVLGGFWAVVNEPPPAVDGPRA